MENVNNINKELNHDMVKVINFVDLIVLIIKEDLEAIKEMLNCKYVINFNNQKNYKSIKKLLTTEKAVNLMDYLVYKNGRIFSLNCGKKLITIPSNYNSVDNKKEIDEYQNKNNFINTYNNNNDLLTYFFKPELTENTILNSIVWGFIPDKFEYLLKLFDILDIDNLDKIELNSKGDTVFHVLFNSIKANNQEKFLDYLKMMFNTFSKDDVKLYLNAQNYDNNTPLHYIGNGKVKNSESNDFYYDLMKLLDENNIELNKIRGYGKACKSFFNEKVHDQYIFYDKTRDVVNNKNLIAINGFMEYAVSTNVLLYNKKNPPNKEIKDENVTKDIIYSISHPTILGLIYGLKNKNCNDLFNNLIFIKQINNIFVQNLINNKPKHFSNKLIKYMDNQDSVIVTANQCVHIAYMNEVNEYLKFNKNIDKEKIIEELFSIKHFYLMNLNLLNFKDINIKEYIANNVPFYKNKNSLIESYSQDLELINDMYSNLLLNNAKNNEISNFIYQQKEDFKKNMDDVLGITIKRKNKPIFKI